MGRAVDGQPGESAEAALRDLRKSTDEGLDQEFNSLDAQREACAAYILSQKHEGWTALPSFYDDGGFSGGSMQRPALRALLADVEAKKIDVVVVYKVDRLTRALADFARIVTIFDAANVSFVSVTQAFNTTSSMGRLTLNVLLSFAQFEREVTAERIRDKIAASKKKGMWMGGAVPFGYRVEARKLVPHPEEAQRVRAIFERYLALGTVPKLRVELERSGQRSRVRISTNGKRSGGAVFSRGNLYALLTNPLVIGRIRHHDEIYPGQHPAIIEQALWDQVQERLAANSVTRSKQPTGNVTSPLAGRLFDPDGNPMRPSHANNGKRRYRYYISRDLMEKTVSAGARGWRIPADEIEGIVARAIISRIEDPAFVRVVIGQKESSANTSSGKVAALRGIAAELATPEASVGRATLRRITRRIDLGEHTLRAKIELAVEGSEDADALAGAAPLMIDEPIAIVHRGPELRLVLRGASTDGRAPDAPMIRLLIHARRWFAAWREGNGSSSLSDIAEAHGVNVGDVSRAVQFAFLAPELVERILDGCQPANLTVTGLKRAGDLPLFWDEQVTALS